ncbi:TIP41-like protein [Atheta coriaria]|uniref:TIP41-like protein n=1 Tax=Dalotia coriaria TaxID=877792 RepID=UPI0031F43FA4
MASIATIHPSHVNIPRLPVDSEEQQFESWLIKYTKSHILHSQCTTADKCANTSSERCTFCVYTNSLAIPHLPEMVFPNNILTLVHNNGGSIEFNALDALQCVCSSSLPFRVACSEAWKESRPAHLLEEKIKPYDWTFSTDYKGSIQGNCTVEPTDERIDMERLKEKEKILFYQELMLYEDELHDNGIAQCTVKIRVMPTSFFVLLRFFLRVDNVMVRINDTRLFHDMSTNYVLREYTNRECSVKEVHLPLPVFGDPNILQAHMPVKTSLYEKLIFEESEVAGSNT